TPGMESEHEYTADHRGGSGQEGVFSAAVRLARSPPHGKAAQRAARETLERMSRGYSDKNNRTIVRLLPIKPQGVQDSRIRNKLAASALSSISASQRVVAALATTVAKKEAGKIA